MKKFSEIVTATVSAQKPSRSVLVRRSFQNVIVP
jgi:hypothetical protein